MRTLAVLVITACLLGACTVPTRHVDYGHGEIVEDGRCADLPHRDHVACVDGHRDSDAGKAVGVVVGFLLGGVVLVGGVIVVFGLLGPVGPTNG